MHQIVFMFFIESVLVAWSSKKQPTMSLSSTEAEYRGATIAIYETIWLRRLLQDLRIQLPTLIPIYWDNISIMQLAKNPAFHARRKNIEVHYHFVCERDLSGEFELQYVQINRQVSDIFTKALRSDKLQRFLEIPGLRYLDVPHFKGRTRLGTTVREKGNENEIGGASERKEVESTKEVSTSDRVRTSGNDDTIK